MKYIITTATGGCYKGNLSGAREFVRRMEFAGVDYTATYDGREVEITPAERVPYDRAAVQERNRKRLARRIGY